MSSARDGATRAGLRAQDAAGVFEENLALPFMTRVLGVEVTVADIDLTDCGIVAICVRETHRQPIPISDLPLPATRPAGSEWIAAYRHWASRR
jgi:hypothetical protein